MEDHIMSDAENQPSVPEAMPFVTRKRGASPASELPTAAQKKQKEVQPEALEHAFASHQEEIHPSAPRRIFQLVLRPAPPYQAAVAPSNIVASSSGEADLNASPMLTSNPLTTVAADAATAATTTAPTSPMALSPAPTDSATTTQPRPPKQKFQPVHLRHPFPTDFVRRRPFPSRKDLRRAGILDANIQADLQKQEWSVHHWQALSINTFGNLAEQKCQQCESGEGGRIFGACKVLDEGDRKRVRTCGCCFWEGLECSFLREAKEMKKEKKGWKGGKGEGKGKGKEKEVV